MDEKNVNTNDTMEIKPEDIELMKNPETAQQFGQEMLSEFSNGKGE